MREDLVVPGEGEENFVLARDARVVTIPFTPLEVRMQKEKPEVFTREEKRAWLDKLTDVTLGSDAFFPFSDNIERAHKSGVKYIAEPGGSVRDDAVIECCNKYDMAMAFTGIRLFHH